MKHLYMPYLCIALILSPLQPILCSKWQLPRLFSEVILFHAKTFGSSAVGLTGEGGSNWNIFEKVEIKSFGQNQNQNSRLWGPWRFVVFFCLSHQTQHPTDGQQVIPTSPKICLVKITKCLLCGCTEYLLCGCTECLLCCYDIMWMYRMFTMWMRHHPKGKQWIGKNLHVNGWMMWVYSICHDSPKPHRCNL